MPDRTFYGGDAPSGGTGDISGGLYTGPGLPTGPWACPACKVENTGRLEDGCVACGAGMAKAQHVGVPSGRTTVQPEIGLTEARNAQQHTGALAGAVDTFEGWWAANTTVLLNYAPKELARVAWQAGRAFAQSQVMQHPPIAADTTAYAPAGKPRRTLLAALRYFRAQILPTAQEEMVSGEWCTLAEADALIRQLEVEED